MEKQKKKRKKWPVVLAVIVAMTLVLAAAAVFFISRMFGSRPLEPGVATDAALVETEKGRIRGSIHGGIYQYLGIPYAQAKERFVPAEEIEPWSGVFEATQTGPMSPQSGMLGMVVTGEQEGTDHNCQTLNLWTPGIADGETRAVMVWLHGGGCSTGSANDQQYHGETLSRNGDVVVVGINHRLGISGFLDLSAYGEKYQYSANVGIADIVSALRWIQDNIEAFGGDPDNVTIFGQSGGGAKVLALMTSPYASGLFHRAIIQSGATETLGVKFTTQEASTRLAEETLKNLGITGGDVEKLQTMPISQLEAAGSAALQTVAEEFQIPAPLNPGYAMEWEPVVDGDYIPSHPVTEDSFAAAGKDIDLLIGSNLNEWSGFMGGGSTPSQQIQEAFAKAYPDLDVSQAGRVDTLIRLPMLKIMSHKADQNGAKVYAYLFTFGAGGMGAYHGAEIPYVFGNVQGGEAQALSEKISQVWVNFAKTGVPSAEGQPQWEPYTRESGATMLLDTDFTLVYHHDRELIGLLAPDYEY